MSLQYKHEALLQNQHRDPIVCLSFSSDASMIACGSLDGKLTIWSCQSRTLLVVVSGSCALLCLSWIPQLKTSLLCGLESGSVISVTIGTEYVSASGYFAHRWPVECLALCEPFAATGSFHEVKVWRYADQDDTSLSGDIDGWRLMSNLGLPRSLGENHDSDVIVTSLLWANTEHSRLTLLVTYLHHGVVFWDMATETGHDPHCLSVVSLAASSCISPDHRYIAIANVNAGFDIYDITTKSPVRGFPHGSLAPVYSPVTFVHDGFALLGGTTGGVARIWDVTTGHSLEPLMHKDNDTIWAVTAHSDASSGQILIATSAKAPNRLPYTALWRAQDIYKRRNLRRRGVLASQHFFHRNYQWFAVIGLLLAGIVAATIGKLDFSIVGESIRLARTRT